MEVYGFEVGKGLMSGKMISQVISLPIYEKKKKEKKKTPQDNKIPIIARLRGQPWVEIMLFLRDTGDLVGQPGLFAPASVRTTCLQTQVC